MTHFQKGLQNSEVSFSLSFNTLGNIHFHVIYDTNQFMSGILFKHYLESAAQRSSNIKKRQYLVYHQHQTELSVKLLVLLFTSLSN